jgi:exodeoxyribonuclease-5
MIIDHLAKVLKSHFDYEPTKGQEVLIKALADFIASPAEKEVLLVKGYAGTGKTSLISALVKTLPEYKMKFLLLAPTGRAAKMLSYYSGQAAYTIHKKIYRQKTTKDGFGVFNLDRNLHSSTLFIVDEASMIGNQLGESSIFGSGNLLDDLIKYVHNDKHCKLILIGDTAQLPPVHTDISPALDRNVLEGYGYQVHEVFLEDVVRHSLDSGILLNATLVRQMIHGKENTFPSLKLPGFPDIERISGNEMNDCIGNAYSKYGQDDTIVVCRSNKQANRYNAGIRNMLLGREEEISKGDYLMVVKNNYHWLKENEQVDFIANGDICRVERINAYQARYGYRFADIVASFVDYPGLEIEVKIILDTLAIEGPSLNSDQNKELYFAIAEDYKYESNRKKQFELVKLDVFYNALQVKFAYAVTCHKAQGGQWKAVFVDQGYLKEDMLNTEYYRWLYTALTRATEKLYLVNFANQFFD